MFIWENPDWPRFTWDRQRLERPLAEVHHKQGLLLGRMEGLDQVARDEAARQTRALEVLKSSEIDGEDLDAGQIAALTTDAIQNDREPLTPVRLADWSGGAWRTRAQPGAPPAEQLELEMTVFLHWFNGTQPIDQVLKAGLAHLWFATIHPFDDGNGRIARAVADMALAKSEQAQRFTSMSAEIARAREDYGAALDAARRATLDITDWLAWFLGTLARAIDGAQNNLGGVLAKARFWEQRRAAAFNTRQREMLGRLLDGVEGRLTTSSWAKLMNCSQDTAHRDIVDLIAKNILRKDESGGRSTSYTMLPLT